MPLQTFGVRCGIFFGCGHKVAVCPGQLRGAIIKAVPCAGEVNTVALVYEKGFSRCEVTLQNGVNGQGEPIFISRVFGRIHPDTSHQNLYDVVQAVFSLQILPIDTVRRIDEGELIQQ